MPLSLADLLAAEGVQLHGSGANLSAKCPFHEDSTPSLSVNLEEGVWKCHGCGKGGTAQTWVMERRGLSEFEAAAYLRDSSPAAPAGRRKSSAKKKVYPELPATRIATHYYRNPEKNVLWAVCRYGPDARAKCTQHIPVEGGWIGQGPGKDQVHVLYRLPELLAAPVSQQVMVVEGEKCADTVARFYARGVVTTWLGGSNAKLDRTDWKPLHGRPVLLVSDGDEPGRKVVQRIAALLVAHCPKVRIVLTPGDTGEDVHDWLEEGGVELAGIRIRDLVTDVERPKERPPAAPGEKVIECASHADLADLFHQDHVSDDACRLRYDVDTGIWWEWGKRGWQVSHALLDEVATVGRRHFVKVMSDGYTKPDRRSGGSLMTATGAERLLRGRPGVLTLSTEWDAAEDVVALPGCEVFDIASGRVSAQSHAQLLRRHIASRPCTDEEFQRSRWAGFLLESLGGDGVLLEWLQRAVGQALLGRGQEHIILFCYGPSRTGKTTFLETLRAAVADYGVTAAAQTFMRRTTGPDHPAGLARLAGARYIVTGEIGEGDVLDDGIVKDLSGRSPITARFMRQNEFSFVSTALLCMQGNTKPLARTLAGLQDRMRFVPFLTRQEVLDPLLKTALRSPAEQAAVVHWLAVGARRWITDGLADTPATVVAQYTDFVKESPIGAFITERVSDDDASSVHNADVYREYVEWCKDNGVDRPVTKVKLGKILRESHEWRLGGAGGQFWIGRRIVNQLPQ